MPAATPCETREQSDRCSCKTLVNRLASVCEGFLLEIVMNKSDWLTVEFLRERVLYNPHSGQFTDRRTGREMTIAKSTKTLYLRQEDGKYLQLPPGRCAWMLMKGEFPKSNVRSKIPNDWRWTNLYVRGGESAEKSVSSDPLAELTEKVRQLRAEVDEIKAAMKGRSCNAPQSE